MEYGSGLACSVFQDRKGGSAVINVFKGTRNGDNHMRRLDFDD